METTNSSVLSEAPIEVQLAVELILLLEQQDLSVKTVLAALAIVQRDFQNKLATPHTNAS